MAQKRYDSTRQWYAVHTYSGYEDKVADSIRQRINAVDMADKIFAVMVPKEKQIEIKNGKRKEGEVVSVIDGPFKGFDGTISEIDTVKGKIKVMVSMFGRDTPVELDALQVKKI